MPPERRWFRAGKVYTQQVCAGSFWLAGVDGGWGKHWKRLVQERS
jgi:hypothetical protein